MAATKTNGKPPVDVEEEEGEDVSAVGLDDDDVGVVVYVCRWCSWICEEVI